MLGARRRGGERFTALSCLLLSVLPASAQGQTPVFRTETTLVELTLVALDKDGNPVTDLEKEEIVVKDKGRRRNLALFRYEGGEQPSTAPKLLPGMFTNSPDLTPGPPRNITAIVLDTLNTQPRDQVWVKAQAMRYLSALLPNTRVAVYLLGRNLTVVHDFTDDAESLRARIERAKVRLAGPAIGQVGDMAREMENLIQSLREKNPRSPETVARLIQVERRAQEAAHEQRMRMTLDSLEALGDHLAGVPGRKSIVWFGAGVTMLSITGSLEFDNPGGSRSHEELVRKTSQRLAQQGITMYMFDARGMQSQADLSVERMRVEPTNVGQINPYERVLANSTISADPVPAMAMFADITGGRYYTNTNDMGRAVAEIAADSQGAYSLGFYADGEPDGKWHGLDVRVSRKGVKLQYRDGYLSAAPPDAPLDWTDDQWRSAVYNPVGSTAVRLDARLRFDGAADARTLTMTLQVVADDLQFRQVDGQSSAAVEMAIVDKLPNAQFRMQRDSREIPFPEGEAGEIGVVHVRHAWELTPGASAVRLIVRDRLSGRYGTLDAPVKDIPHAEPHPHVSAATGSSAP